MIDFKPGIYRHFKGELYRVERLVYHSETQEKLVLYQALYGDKEYWVRPISMFFEQVKQGEEKVARFEFVSA